nr:GNAT family N-acyltransferase [Micromonospora sp. DSM 115978]
METRRERIASRLCGPSISTTLDSLGLFLDVRGPVGDDVEREPDWISDIRRFRGESLWEDGMRPQFRQVDGAFQDADPHDLVAYHLLLRSLSGGAIIACARVSPLEALPDSRVRAWHPALAERLLTTYGCRERDVLEPARLVVAPQWRTSGRLGLIMVLAIASLGRALGRRMQWFTPGTRQNQHRIMLLVGWEICEEFGRREAPAIMDTLCVMVGSSYAISVSFEPAVAALTEIIDDKLTSGAGILTGRCR